MYVFLLKKLLLLKKEKKTGGRYQSAQDLIGLGNYLATHIRCTCTSFIRCTVPQNDIVPSQLEQFSSSFQTYCNKLYRKWIWIKSSMHGRYSWLQPSWNSLRWSSMSDLPLQPLNYDNRGAGAQQERALLFFSEPQVKSGFDFLCTCSSVTQKLVNRGRLPAQGESTIVFLFSTVWSLLLSAYCNTLYSGCLTFFVKTYQWVF